MNQSLLSLCIITVGIGLCGFFGAQLPSTVYKQTSSTMARDWIKTAKLKGTDSSTIKDAQTRLTNQMNQLKLSPSTRLNQWGAEKGILFALGLLMILVGSFWSRKIAHDALRADMHSSEDKSASYAIDFSVLLSEISQDLNVIRDQLMDVGSTSKFLDTQSQIQQPLTDQAHQEKIAHLIAAIDQLQKEKIARLVSAKDQVQIKYGLSAFTEIFGPFSQGERRLNRCWSALVDKHLLEAQESVEFASQSIEEAVLVLKQLSNQET